MATPQDGCAWITGASSGIGRALALRLARDGWTVAASARSEARLDDLALQAAAVAAGAGRVVAVPCDVTDRDAVRRAVETVETAHGPIALAVLNAGTYRQDSAVGFDSTAFAATIDLNLMGTVHGIEALLPRWIERRRGHLAVVSSVAGYRGLPRALAYGASKAALINLCEGLKFDFDRLGLKIQVINPGFVRTPLTDRNDFPMPMLMEVEDAADRIARGLQDKRFEIGFPFLFVQMLRRLRCLPYGVYFPLLKRATGR